MATPTTHSIPVDGGLLHVGVWDGGERVVLAIHGGTSSHTVWSTIVAELAGAATVIAPDFRGAAGSEHVGPPYGLRAHCDDMQRVLDHFEVDRAVVTGWSLGGFIATNAAAALGDRTAAVVLVDGGIPLALPAGFDPVATHSRLIEPARQRERNGELLGVNFDAMSADVMDTLTGDTRDAARRVKVPMSFVWAERGLQGEPEGYYPLAAIHEFAAHHPLRIAEGHDLDHFSVMLSPRGAQLVADELRWALSTG
ncbi:MAG: alpha/beta hydrolase [Acidimicrobiales bacterium]